MYSDPRGTKVIRPGRSPLFEGGLGGGLSGGGGSGAGKLSIWDLCVGIVAGILAAAGGTDSCAGDCEQCDNEERRKRGQQDPNWATGNDPVDPGRDCDGNCFPCPPEREFSQFDPKKGHHRHAIVWNQNPETCICYPDRVHLD